MRFLFQLFRRKQKSSQIQPRDVLVSAKNKYPSKLESLPLEILCAISQFLSLREYNNLQSTSKSLRKLPYIAILTMDAFIETFNGSQKVLNFIMSNDLVRLEKGSRNKTSLLFCAKIGYASEFRRILGTCEISDLTKLEAFSIITSKVHYFSRDNKFLDEAESMIIDLITIGKVNYCNILVDIYWGIDSGLKNYSPRPFSDKGTLFHWSCIRGYERLGLLILNESSLDVNKISFGGKNALQLSFIGNYSGLLNLILRHKRIDSNEIISGINWNRWISNV